MAGSKLVESLAESLVNELNDSKTLNLVNEEKFKEFTHLLWVILDKQTMAENREKDRDNRENMNQNESLENVKELTDRINEYFKNENGKGSMKDIAAKTDLILDIVQKLQKGTGGKKKGDDKNTESAGKEINDNVGLNEKKEAEQKAEETQRVTKQTNDLLKNLTKNFENSEKKRAQEATFTKKRLKRIERKVGSLIWRAFNKIKGLLFLGLIFFFREPIWNFIKDKAGMLWDWLKPHVMPVVEWLGEKLGNVWAGFKEAFKADFPELTNWIKNDWPEIKKWFKNHWNDFKDWVMTTFPEIQRAIDAILDSWIVRHFRKNKIDDERRELQEKWMKTTKELGYDSLAAKELELKIAKLDYEYREADHQFKGEDKYSLVNTGTGYQNVLVRGESYRKVVQKNIDDLESDIEAKKKDWTKRVDFYTNIIGNYSSKPNEEGTGKQYSSPIMPNNMFESFDSIEGATTGPLDNDGTKNINIDGSKVENYVEIKTYNSYSNSQKNDNPYKPG